MRCPRLRPPSPPVLPMPMPPPDIHPASSVPRWDGPFQAGARTDHPADGLHRGQCAGRVAGRLWHRAFQHTWQDDPSTVVDADAVYFDTMTLVLSGLNFLVLTATGIATMTWLYQAYGSRQANPALLPHARWWTIGGWLIPFISLVRPFQLMRISTWQQPPRRRLRRACPPWWSPSSFGWWWVCYLLGKRAHKRGQQADGRRGRRGRPGPAAGLGHPGPGRPGGPDRRSRVHPHPALDHSSIAAPAPEPAKRRAALARHLRSRSGAGSPTESGRCSSESSATATKTSVR